MFGQTPPPEPDYEAPSPPEDGISSLSWSPKANFLVSGSWDNKVRCWEVQNNPANKQILAQPRSAVTLEAPILSTCWSADGGKVFTGGCDNKVMCWIPGNPTPQQIGLHQAPVKSVAWIEELGTLCSGSWDKTLKYWDGRQPKPAFELTLADRVYAMDVKYPLSVVATAERHVYIYDLKKPQQEFKKMISPLKFQTRCVSCFHNSTGYAIGSIEGRVGIQDIQEDSKSFAFKCHRVPVEQNNPNNTKVYAVNSISFHPKFGTFATTGADGSFHFWDKDSKQRLKNFGQKSGPIPVGTFNADGAMFAYAVSYDWSQGSEGYSPQQQRNLICIHPAIEDEIKPKPKKK